MGLTEGLVCRIRGDGMKRQYHDALGGGWNGMEKGDREADQLQLVHFAIGHCALAKSYLGRDWGSTIPTGLRHQGSPPPPALRARSIHMPKELSSQLPAAYRHRWHSRELPKDRRTLRPSCWLAGWLAGWLPACPPACLLPLSLAQRDLPSE